MEQDPSRRHHLSPRSSSLLDLSSHRRLPSPSLLQSPAATPRFGSTSSLGSGSGSSSYKMPSSPLVPTSGGGTGARTGGSSARHVRSFSLASLGAGSGFSSNYQLPPSRLGRTSGVVGGSARHSRSFSQTTLGSGSSYFQTPPSHHARCFSQPPLFSSLDSCLPQQDLYAELPNFLHQASSSSRLQQPRITSQSETTLFGLSQHELPPLPTGLPPETASVNMMADAVPLDDCDDIVGQYVDLDGLCGLKSSGDGTEEPHVPTTGSQPSGGLSPAVGTGNGAVPSLSMSLFGTNINITAGAGSSGGSKPWHFGSPSADRSSGMFDFETKPKLTLPSPRPRLPWAARRRRSSLSHSGSGTSMDGTPAAPLVAEYADGSFTEEEIKRIKADNRLAQLVLSDPKRVKRILVNRMTAQRAKERKIKYVSDLERKVQALQIDAKSLTERLQSLQSKSAELTTENKELRIKLHGMEQKAKLTTALNQAITAEVQRLKSGCW